MCLNQNSSIKKQLLFDSYALTGAKVSQIVQLHWMASERPAVSMEDRQFFFDASVDLHSTGLTLIPARLTALL